VDGRLQCRDNDGWPLGSRWLRDRREAKSPVRVARPHQLTRPLTAERIEESDLDSAIQER